MDRALVLAALAAFANALGVPVFSTFVGDHDVLAAAGAKVVSNVDGFPVVYLRLTALANVPTVIIEHAAGWEELFPESCTLELLTACLESGLTAVELMGPDALDPEASPARFALHVVSVTQREQIAA